MSLVYCKEEILRNRKNTFRYIYTMTAMATPHAYVRDGRRVAIRRVKKRLSFVTDTADLKVSCPLTNTAKAGQMIKKNRIKFFR